MTRLFFFSSKRRHTRSKRDWSSDVCSSDLMGLFATNFGEGWRMAVGADASAKMLSFFSTLPVALASWWPSLHPLDLLVGLCCGAGLRLAVYLKSKNRSEEHTSELQSRFQI